MNVHRVYGETIEENNLLYTECRHHYSTIETRKKTLLGNLNFTTDLQLIWAVNFNQSQSTNFQPITIKQCLPLKVEKYIYHF